MGGSGKPACRARRELGGRFGILRLTALPTAPGREERVEAWIRRWVRARPQLVLRRDGSGNLLLARRDGGGRGARAKAPFWFTAHLDHPAFVALGRPDSRRLELEFRGMVHESCFPGAPIELLGSGSRPVSARVESAEPGRVSPRRVVVRTESADAPVRPGDVGRWRFPRWPRLPAIRGRRLHSHACDDLAPAAAALAALDRLRLRPDAAHVGLLLTRAEEVGFLGAIAACRRGTIPRNARLLCLEASRSYPDSPLGAGPVLRVGDRIGIFDADLSYRVAALMERISASAPSFRWQRKLMPGGVCEASAFGAFGFRAAALCLPLGHYHNMRDPDTARGPCRLAPEIIDLGDYLGLVETLVFLGRHLDDPDPPPLRTVLLRRFRANARLLDPAGRPG